jgi:hypothetical protein
MAQNEIFFVGCGEYGVLPNGKVDLSSDGFEQACVAAETLAQQYPDIIDNNVIICGHTKPACTTAALVSREIQPSEQILRPHSGLDRIQKLSPEETLANMARFIMTLRGQVSDLAPHDERLVVVSYLPLLSAIKMHDKCVDTTAEPGELHVHSP